ncbi:Metallo-hydrolase/oxidoreductase [Paraphaeosphaeria sporulosa]|uniref:Metallo-hydrolase/oxidoreductase n=1 Tax=Paraphaeosphaeria sporulosa TaxID=1460663 RepID=A0A177BZX8_9PLEO|nr:Metallo-hydrolase/oxidoreductase [Paraphaeosphaeria sporulosa]OAG01094.1 Metallo-hydrolase/oxidoreductase [Paraphaeosphaeria sporulosa]
MKWFASTIAVFAAFGTGKDVLLYSPTAYTLIHSDKQAVLVDTPTLAKDGAVLAKWIANTAPGVSLKYIYITHAHADHFNSLTTDGVIEHMPAQYEGPLWDYFWKGLFPSIEKTDLSLVQVLPADGKFTIDDGKHELHAIVVGEGDTVDSTVLHVPSLDLVVGSDVVYGHCYQYLAENPTSEMRARWLQSLDKIAQLKPKIVIPSHMQAFEDFGTQHLAETKQYIHTWDLFLHKAKSWEELEGMAKKRFPERIGTFILRYTAQSFFNATF